jgi:hypothetical protein
MGKIKTAVRAAFALLATSIAVNSVSAYPTTLQTMPVAATGSATAEDHAKLDVMFAAASNNMLMRAADARTGCEAKLDGTGMPGTFRNSDIPSVTSLSELLPRRTPEVATRYKVFAAMADLAGYKVCYDTRLSPGDYIYTINTLDKVIALDPKPFPGPAPLAAQQMAYASALENLFTLTKGFTEAASFTNIPGLARNPSFASLPTYIAPNLPIGSMTPRVGEVVPGHVEDIAKKLLPSPVRQPKELPWDLQKALRIYWV